MTKKQFIRWATSKGFAPGGYGHMVRHTRNHYQKVIFTERFRLCLRHVIYEKLQHHTMATKNKNAAGVRGKTITWDWIRLGTVPYRRMRVDENNNSYTLDLILAPEFQPDFFPKQ